MTLSEADNEAKKLVDQAVATQTRLGYEGRVPEAAYQQALRDAARAVRSLIRVSNRTNGAHASAHQAPPSRLHAQTG